MLSGFKDRWDIRQQRHKIARLAVRVEPINELETDYECFSSAELRAKTDEFRARIAEAVVEELETYAIGHEAEELAEALAAFLPDRGDGDEEPVPGAEFTAPQEGWLAARVGEVLSAFDAADAAETRVAAIKGLVTGPDAWKAEETLRSAAAGRMAPEIESILKIFASARAAETRALDALLPEAFAAVREAAKRALGQRHFDVQLVGGMVLHEGKIAEMKTGEGKTLVATLPLYLNALTGRSVHVVTVNDYLARRDCGWMGQIFHLLGLSTSAIFPPSITRPNYTSAVYDPDFTDNEAHDERLAHLRPCSRREAYLADVTYGTNAEFGFDYLRDNMAVEHDEVVQRGRVYAIVDEVDSILIDEARTPLIISGPVERDDAGPYEQLRDLVKELRRKQEEAIKDLLRDPALLEVREILRRGLDESDPEREEAVRQLLRGEETMEKLMLVKRGDPKNEILLDLIARAPRLKRDLDSKESKLSLALKMQSHEAQEALAGELLCVIDEHAHTVELTDKGLDFFAHRGLDLKILGLHGESEDVEEPDPGPADAEAAGAEAAPVSAAAALFGGEESGEELRYRQASERMHAIHQLIRAYWLFQPDVNYVVKGGQVLIVDEFTGRLMPGRRWSDGLHEAIEAKEGVRVAEQNQTLATITIQNYFRMYTKLAGMTGTANTEAAEFRKIYGLDVAVIPTNLPMVRRDHPDVVFRTQKYKERAIAEEIKELHQRGQPILVGTITIQHSDFLSDLLKREHIPHQVLNARFHEQEAEIIAQAGRLKAVTIATNMAGRGTDIMLGGNPDFLAREILHKEGVDRAAPTTAQLAAARARAEAITRAEREQVLSLGGLHVVGTERHESRRIDNQLRGRSGRQGDPGSSRFYVSLEDDLMRLFGGEMISSFMSRLGWAEDMPIDHPRISKSIENAQRKVEARNFDLRENVLKYDDVLNKQREYIYGQRRELLAGNDVRGRVRDTIGGVIDRLIETRIPEKEAREEWDLEDLLRAGRATCLPWGISGQGLEGLSREELRAALKEKALAAYEEKERQIGAEQLRELERIVLLRTIDTKWMDHLQNMDDLREGIGLQAYGQREPLVEYQFEAYRMFKAMLDETQSDVIRYLTSLQLRREEEPRRRKVRRVMTNRDESGAAAIAQRRVDKKVGRNDPCPCGSGRKYKKCCGATA